MGDGAVGLHVPERILGGVEQRAGIAQLLVARVGNARLFCITIVEAHLCLQVDADKLLQAASHLSA